MALTIDVIYFLNSLFTILIINLDIMKGEYYNLSTLQKILFSKFQQGREIIKRIKVDNE